jgi:hypothetical protein
VACGGSSGEGEGDLPDPDSVLGLYLDKMPRSCEGDLMKRQARRDDHEDAVVAPEDVQIHSRVVVHVIQTVGG